MHVFVCQVCGQLLHFENSVCLRCGSMLGFIPGSLVLSACERHADGAIQAVAEPGAQMRECANAEAAGCNWLVPAEIESPYCDACRLNRTIPDLAVEGNTERWQAIEAAKRRLVYALKRLKLPLVSMVRDAENGLAFDFLADRPKDPVLTGHADGLITINISEADSPERERRRIALDERYRTLLGHLRHEVGHYYWDILVRDGNKLEEARTIFGDDRADYSEALERHYEVGPPNGWETSYVSAYATMHPWEDFAETWTHYLHMADTLDTAASFGMEIDPVASESAAVNADVTFDPYSEPNFSRLVDAWIPLTVAVNSLNRSMGQRDLYPFALSKPAIAKLGFIHDLVRGAV
ncbi:MAG: putative zinc-binding peptidase [Pseudomonadota bacterium]